MFGHDCYSYEVVFKVKYARDGDIENHKYVFAVRGWEFERDAVLRKAKPDKKFRMKYVRDLLDSHLSIVNKQSQPNILAYKNVSFKELPGQVYVLTVKGHPISD